MKTETKITGTFVDLVHFFQDPHRYVKKNNRSILRYSLIPLNWVIQRSLYADRTENAFKLLFDVAVTGVLFLLFYPAFGIASSLILAFFVAHTMNWMLNGGFWTLFTSKFGLRVLKNEITPDISHVRALQERISGEGSLLCASIYGSFSRKEDRQNSDLDVRIIRRPGIMNGIRASYFGFTERARAFFVKFPLDLYILDSTAGLARIRADEPPIILFDPEKILEHFYQEFSHVQESAE